VIDHEILSTLFALYLCPGMYGSYQFLAKVKGTSTGKLLGILPKNDAMAEQCSGELKVTYCRDPEGKNTNTYIHRLRNEI
jgi:hypothetical protein